MVSRLVQEMTKAVRELEKGYYKRLEEVTAKRTAKLQEGTGDKVDQACLYSLLMAHLQLSFPIGRIVVGF